tara:strand:+ start:2234 stop:3634 length:1401 start_codon:yes stop_codon:yes gene_type:complete
MTSIIQKLTFILAVVIVPENVSLAQSNPFESLLKKGLETVIEKGLAQQQDTQVMNDNPNAVRLVQERLNSLGYTAGEANGVFGSETRGAILSFELDQGMDPKGNVTQILIEAISRGLENAELLQAQESDSTQTAQHSIEQAPPPNNAFAGVNEPPAATPVQEALSRVIDLAADYGSTFGSAYSCQFVRGDKVIPSLAHPLGGTRGRYFDEDFWLEILAPDSVRDEVRRNAELLSAGYAARNAYGFASRQQERVGIEHRCSTDPELAQQRLNEITNQLAVSIPEFLKLEKEDRRTSATRQVIERRGKIAEIRRNNPIAQSPKKTTYEFDHTQIRNDKFRASIDEMVSDCEESYLLPKYYHCSCLAEVASRGVLNGSIILGDGQMISEAMEQLTPRRHCINENSLFNFEYDSCRQRNKLRPITDIEGYCKCYAKNLMDEAVLSSSRFGHMDYISDASLKAYRSCTAYK